MQGKDSGGRPRIAVFTKSLDNWRSGSGHHLDAILNEALDLNEGRFDFTFVHYKPSDNPIYRRARELIVPRSPLGSAAALRRGRFDVVHYSPLTVYAPIWGVPGRKMATVHGAEQLLVPRFYGPIEMAHELFVVPPYIRRMDAIVTVSNTSANFFVRRYRVRPERIAVCYNGLSPEFRVLRPDEVTAPARLGIEGPFILHVSRFSERKNPWTLLEAFARLVRDGSDCSLVCAGGGWDNEALRSRARALGIEARLRLPGFVSERDEVELLNAARAFVYPSFAEGFGMPNVEAMGCGCPVVTTPAFAVREIVGDAALVVEDPSDAAALAAALRRAATDEALRAGLRERGFARLGLFSWEDSARRLLGVYERLAAG